MKYILIPFLLLISCSTSTFQTHYTCIAQNVHFDRVLQESVDFTCNGKELRTDKETPALILVKLLDSDLNHKLVNITFRDKRDEWDITTVVIEVTYAK